MRIGTRAALAMAALLASLSLVAWRQGRAYEVRQALDDFQSELALSRSTQFELRGEIASLQSRDRIVEVAAERLGLYPANNQVVFLPTDWD